VSRWCDLPPTTLHSLRDISLPSSRALPLSFSLCGRPQRSTLDQGQCCCSCRVLCGCHQCYLCAELDWTLPRPCCLLSLCRNRADPVLNNLTHHSLHCTVFTVLAAQPFMVCLPWNLVCWMDGPCVHVPTRAHRGSDVSSTATCCSDRPCCPCCLCCLCLFHGVFSPQISCTPDYLAIDEQISVSLRVVPRDTGHVLSSEPVTAAGHQIRQ